MDQLTRTDEQADSASLVAHKVNASIAP